VETEREKRAEAKRDADREPVKKKTKEGYHEHIESINSFVAKRREKMDIPDAICLFCILISSCD
jgi:hypothetical protein